VTTNSSRLRIQRREFLKAAMAGAIVAPAELITKPILTASARSASSDEPERKERAMRTGGFSRSRLDRMHEVMTGYVKRGELPGLVLLLSRRGEVHVRENMAGAVGRFGWDGGLGTSWYADPHEDLVGILMTQRAWTSPVPPNVCQDFWTLAYQAIDD
jgi:hypothetical protein